MEIIINVEYAINLILLLLYSMHMFQLNSYVPKKHSHWAKKNKKTIIVQLLLIIIPTAILLLNLIEVNISQILTILLLAISIVYNIPKKKSKIPLKFTSRVKRMFITEIIIIILVLLIGQFEKYIAIKLAILNLISGMLCIIANFINHPIEKMVRQKYINEAKKIIKGMPNLTVIGVTGSYGKTSVKNFLYKTLSAKYEVLITPKNYNTTMGVVKTIRENLKPTHQIFVCEMGATNVGDIKEICDIVNPKYGVITSIGPQHLETFKLIENVVKTKFELAYSVKKNSGVVFLNYNNDYIANNKIDMDVVSYGVNDDKINYNAYDLNSSSKGLTFKMKNQDNKEIEFKTKLIGSHNITNIAGAIAVANFLGIPMENLVSRVAQIQSVPHRLELISHGNFTIIDDAYNSNPVSSKSALDTLGEFEGTKIVVTPGLIELGDKEDKYNFELGEYMTQMCDYIFLVGEEHSKKVLEGINSKNFDKEKIFIVSSPQEAIKQIATMNISGKVTALLENDLPDNYK